MPDRFFHNSSAILRRDEQGYTLIEILITMAIFSIGLLAVGSMQISSTLYNTSSGKRTIATTLAQDRMERLIALPYADSDLTDANEDGAGGLDNATANSADHADSSNPIEGQYNIFWNVAEGRPISHTKTLRVLVTWQNGSKRVALSCIKEDVL